MKLYLALCSLDWIVKEIPKEMGAYDFLMIFVGILQQKII